LTKAVSSLAAAGVNEPRRCAMSATAIQSDAPQLAVLGRYAVTEEGRALVGRRIEGEVNVYDYPVDGRGRRYFVERGFESKAEPAVLIADHRRQAQRLGACPMSREAIERLSSLLPSISCNHLNKPKTSPLNHRQRTHNPKVAGSNPAPAMSLSATVEPSSWRALGSSKAFATASETVTTTPGPFSRRINPFLDPVARDKGWQDVRRLYGASAPSGWLERMRSR
jgi:hypothetical protein